ncbi:MAG: carboxypeptidase-like regulatory domain-containing protein [Microscillaceae bacterium]|nr:carboxypeptidase-like regulatory domain-containing protein [Microscillaceae bacterium]
MKYILLIFTVIPLQYQIKAQDSLKVEAIVLDKNNQPLPYVSIGVPKANVGTVSDEKGRFKLELTHFSEKDTILISHLGYKRLNLPLPVFLETLNKNQNKIFLEEKPLVLKEIKVLGDKINMQAYSYENKTKPVLPKFFVFFTNNSNLGLEIARKIDVKQKGPFLLKSVSLEIGLNEYESRVMRMKFYSLANDLPDKLIIEKDIIFRIINKQKEFTIDVTDYDIWLMMILSCLLS